MNDDLVRSVLDGDEVDWGAQEAASTPRSWIRHLQLVATVARVCRDAPPVQASTEWGHLRVLERVGRGSFGEVFRAWDTRLDREVALKLLPAALASGQESASHILREGRLLARVRHPNVVTIYGAEQIADRIGLWMEFVRGATLDQLIRSGHRFPSAEIVQIGVELCRAISAVHAAGLLHRDVKAQNVMRAEDGRIVLMDFGTGRELDEGSPTEVAGTPLYLAPELFRGAEPAVASDVYSIGVLLYLLATGAYPVRAESVRALRDAHERGERVPVREAAPAAGARLAGIIDRAIDPDPARRFQTSAELESSLVQLQQPQRRKPLLVAALAATLTLTGLTAWTFWPSSENGSTGIAPPSTPPVPPVSSEAGRGPSSGVTPPDAVSPGTSLSTGGQPVAARPKLVRQPGVRPSVEVLPFTNVTGRSGDAWLGAVLAEILLREFRGSEAFRWIPGAAPLARVQLGNALRHEAQPLGPGSAGPNSAGFARSVIILVDQAYLVRPVVPADVVVSGEYRASGRPGDVQVTVRIEHRTAGAAALTFAESGTTTNLVGLASRLGARARAAVGVAELTPDQAATIRASQPANGEAARAYVDGLTRSTPESIALFKQAVAADSRFAPAYIALAEAFRNDRSAANAAAAQAVGLSSALPREEQMLIQIRANFLQITQQSVSQISSRNRGIFAELFRLYPDTLLYGIETANGLYATKQTQQALGILDAVRRLPGGSEDVRLLELEHISARAIRDYPRAIRALGQIADLAAALDDRWLLGFTRLHQSTLALEMGNPTQALGLAEESRLQLDLAGALHYVPQVRMAIDSIVHDRGFAWARQEYEQLIAKAAERGDRLASSALSYSLGVLLLGHGDLAEALQAVQQSQRDPGGKERPYIAAASVAIGTVLYRQGDLPSARRMFDAAVLEAQLRREKSQERLANVSLAELLLDQGEVAEARRYSDRSAKDPDSPVDQIPEHRLSALLHLAQGDAVAASAQLSEAMSRRTQLTLHDRNRFAVSMTETTFLLERGFPREAREVAERAVLLAREASRPDDEAAAESLLALAWQADGNSREAQQVMTRVEQRLKVTQDRLLRLSAGIALARVQAATGASAGVGAARQRLNTLLVEAETIGAVSMAYEARLSLGEIEMKAGDAAAGRARLAALERDATAKGLINIATKAAAAAAR